MKALTLVLLLLLTSNLKGQKLLKTMTTGKTIYWVDLSEDGSRVVAAGKDTTVYIYNSKGKELLRVVSHESSVSSVRVLQKSKRLLSSAYDYNAIISDWQGNTLHRLKGHKKGVINIGVSDDEQLICTVSRDKTAKLWTSEGQLISDLTAHTEQVNFAVFMHNDAGFLTGAFDGNIIWWDLKGKQLKQFHPSDAGIRTLTLSADQKEVYAGHKDGSVSVTNLETGKIRSFQAHTEMIGSVVIHKSGLIFTCSGEMDIKMWNQDFELLKTWKAHDYYVSSLDLVDDLLASSSGDGTVKLWNIARLVARNK